MSMHSLMRWLNLSPGPKRRQDRAPTRGRRFRRKLQLEALEVRALLTGNPAQEPNETFDQAVDLGTGDQEHLGLSIDPAGDIDVFQWTAPHDGTLDVSILFSDAAGDLELELFNSAPTRIGKSFSLTDNEYITGVDVYGGETYFIRVKGYSSATNTYDLVIDGPDATVVLDRFEPNNSFLSASDLGTGDQVQSNLSIHSAIDEDWFQWSPPVDGLLTVGALFSHATGNVDLQLYNSNNSLIGQSNSFTDNEQIVHSVTAGQDYFIRVFTPGSETQQSYHLTIDGPELVPSDLQIIDDGDAGFHTEGTWTRAGGAGYDNDVLFSVYDSQDDSATWTFPVIPGRYRVSATWLSNPSRQTDVQYSVLDNSTTLADVLIDQVQAPNDFFSDGASWEDLGGPYDITGSTLSVRLQDAADELLIADAVRIERIGGGTVNAEITVLDGSANVGDGATVDFGTTAPNVPVDKTFTVRNDGTTTLTLSPINPAGMPTGFSLLSNFGQTSLAPGASTTFTIRMLSPTLGQFSGAVSFINNDANENPFDLILRGAVSQVQIIDNEDLGFTLTGSWTLGTNGFQDDVRFHAAGNGSATARWTFDVVPGQYRVWATWSAHPNRASDAPFRILNGSQVLTTVRVNQEQAPNDLTDRGASWEQLGSGFVITGNKLTVQLSDAANEFVIADAIRIEAAEVVGETGPEIQILDGTTNIVDGGTVDFGETFADVPVDKTLTVRNIGSQTLNLTSLQSATLPAGFDLVQDLGRTTLSPNTSTTFRIRLRSESAGTFSGPLALVNNDADENPFDLTLTGDVSSVLVLDNGDAGFHAAGGWTHGMGQGYEGDNHFSAAGSGADVATWTFNVSPGRYRVSATWPSHPNRATNSPFEIRDDGILRATARINQELAPNDFSDAGATWENLGGVHTITGNTLSVRLTDQANEFVIADAIRVQRLNDVVTGPDIELSDGTSTIPSGGTVNFGATVPNVPVDKTLVVRNTGTQTLILSQLQSSTMPAGFQLLSGFANTSLAPQESTTFSIRMVSPGTGVFGGSVLIRSNDPDEDPFDLRLSGTVSAGARIIDDGDLGFTTTGTWQQGIMGFQDDMRFHAAGVGANRARWTFNVTPGQYRVYATWSAHANRATNAPFTILNGSQTLATIPVNQELAPNDVTVQGTAWERVGSTYQVTGSTLVVELSDNANEFVIADAIRVEAASVSEPGPEITLQDGTNEITSGGTVDFGSTDVNQPVVKTLTVRNVGSQNLTLQQLNASSMPAGFNLVSGLGSTTLKPGTSTTFRIALQSTVGGVFTGSISIGNNDADENPYRIFLQGTVTDVQIVDNGDAGFFTSGNWTTGTAQGFQGDIAFSAPGIGSDVATWTFNVTPGQYRVTATWPPHPNRATNSPFTIRSGSTVLKTTRVNQELAPGPFQGQGASWYSLGVVDIASNTLEVRLTDDANDIVIADAVRIERVGNVGQNPVFEPNESIAQAADLGTGDQTHYDLAIDSDTDQDYFRWMATGAGELMVEIRFLDASGDLDMVLYDAVGHEVATSSSIEDYERVTYDVLAGEVYFIHVYGYEGATNTYNLTIDGP